METSVILTAIGALAALVGVFFLVLAFTEYRKLSKIRDDFQSIRVDLRKDLENVQRAMQLVIASYSVESLDGRISLLEKAVEICPDVFNGFNALGYAYLADNKPMRAIDAFNSAVRNRPSDKAGFFDLACAYLKIHDRDLALKQLKKAVLADPSSRHDLPGNPLFAELSDLPEYKSLLQ